MNYYEILGVSPNASSSDIKKAYHRLAKKYHPDSTNLPKNEAERMMALINEAYESLSSGHRSTNTADRESASRTQSYSRETNNSDSSNTNKKSEGTGGDTEEPKHTSDNFNGARTNQSEEESWLTRIILYVVLIIIIISIICCIVYYAPGVLRNTLYDFQYSIEKIIDSFK